MADRGTSSSGDQPMEPLTRRQKTAFAEAPPAPVIDPADRISKLPEEIQAQILSFLPAQEAVRTCVLARTWRHAWRFTRRLLITGTFVEEVCEFVDRLLRLRRDELDLAPLEASEISFSAWEQVKDGDVYLDRKDMSNIKRWVRRVLECQIQTLRVDIWPHAEYECFDTYLTMSTRHLVSRHLTRLELNGILFICRCLDMDCCPALEYLKIKDCCLRHVRKITSLSLRRLVIKSCKSNQAHNRIRVCVPRLVSLWLDLDDVRTPLLERMPELVMAKVLIESDLDDCMCDYPMDCYHVTRDGDTSDIDSDSGDDEEGDGDTSDIDSDSGDHEEGSGDYAGQNITKCVLLEGLAQARDLVLIAHRPTYILRRDLRWCPTFSKLKTLVLTQVYRDDPADLSVLECMLEHAPLLEKLKLTLSKELFTMEGIFKVEIKGYPDADAKVTSTKISQHLQIVEINCEYVNGICLNVLNFLATHNICCSYKVQTIFRTESSPIDDPINPPPIDDSPSAPNQTNSAAHGGEPVNTFHAYGLSHKGKATSDVVFIPEDPADTYNNPLVHTKIQTYTQGVREVHGPDYDPTTQPIDADVLMRVGGGNKHGRYFVVDGSVSSSSRLSEIRAKSTSGSLPICERPTQHIVATLQAHMDQERAIFQAQLEQKRKAREEEMAASREREMANLQSLVDLWKFVQEHTAASTSPPMPNLVFPPPFQPAVTPFETPMQSAASNDPPGQGTPPMHGTPPANTWLEWDPRLSPFGQPTQQGPQNTWPPR